jgi:hypothetical protein
MVGGGGAVGASFLFIWLEMRLEMVREPQTAGTLCVGGDNDALLKSKCLYIQLAYVCVCARCRLLD